MCGSLPRPASEAEPRATTYKAAHIDGQQPILLVNTVSIAEEAIPTYSHSSVSFAGLCALNFAAVVVRPQGDTFILSVASTAAAYT